MITKFLTRLSAPARGLAVLALIVAGGFLLGACGGGGGPAAPRAASRSVQHPVASADPSGLDLTEAVMDKVWTGYTDGQKNDVCAEADGQTPAWVAGKLREGGEDSPLINWNEAAMYLITACQIENR